jgi:hypothetical protein
MKRLGTVSVLRGLIVGTSVLWASCTPRDPSLKTEKTLEEIKQIAPVITYGRVSFDIRNFCLDDFDSEYKNEKFEEVYVRNLSGHITQSGLLTDFDRDGLPDAVETGPLASEFNLDPRKPDSNGDGYSDLVVYSAGITAKSQEYLSYRDCPYPKDQYTTQDWISDCEKHNVLFSDRMKMDQTGIGIPDFLALISGLNPSDAAQKYQETASSGVSNVIRAKRGIPLDQSINATMKDLIPTLKMETEKEVSELPSCQSSKRMRIQLNRIPLAPTDNDNLILVIFQSLKTVEDPETKMLKEQSHLLMCCSLQRPNSLNRSVTLNWNEGSDRSRYSKLMCPCPRLTEIPSRGDS